VRIENRVSLLKDFLPSGFIESKHALRNLPEGSIGKPFTSPLETRGCLSMSFSRHPPL
jgi:hypothetical protein